jgi:hypothetical protein
VPIEDASASHVRLVSTNPAEITVALAQ